MSRIFVAPRACSRTARDGLAKISCRSISSCFFDLGVDSLLEPVTTSHASFRVTQYDPAKMARSHMPGRHQYLIARAIIEADVVVNLPKLKTHKKAGVTCALKNLIGINGNKEYLPHHRVGGSESGGDCYPGGSRVKRALEFTYDRLNTAGSEAAGRGWSAAARVLRRMAFIQGDKVGVEGSWSGNDTIWRTCLDLNRILLYGRSDGSMADEPQRRVLNIVDAIVAGHGDGPLAPQPAPIGHAAGGEQQRSGRSHWGTTAGIRSGQDSNSPQGVRRVPLVNCAVGCVRRRRCG